MFSLISAIPNSYGEMMVLGLIINGTLDGVLSGATMQTIVPTVPLEPYTVEVFNAAGTCSVISSEFELDIPTLDTDGDGLVDACDLDE